MQQNDGLVKVVKVVKKIVSVEYSDGTIHNMFK